MRLSSLVWLVKCAQSGNKDTRDETDVLVGLHIVLSLDYTIIYIYIYIYLFIIYTRTRTIICKKKKKKIIKI